MVIMMSVHCLGDLLLHNSIGELNLGVAAVVSNHPGPERIAGRSEVPFRHIPVQTGHQR